MDEVWGMIRGKQYDDLLKARWCWDRSWIVGRSCDWCSFIIGLMLCGCVPGRWQVIWTPNTPSLGKIYNLISSLFPPLSLLYTNKHNKWSDMDSYFCLLHMSRDRWQCTNSVTLFPSVGKQGQDMWTDDGKDKGFWDVAEVRLGKWNEAFLKPCYISILLLITWIQICQLSLKGLDTDTSPFLISYMTMWPLPRCHVDVRWCHTR